MSSQKIKNKKQQKKILRLSKKKLGLNSSSQNSCSSTFRYRNKDTIVVVTKMKTSKSFKDNFISKIELTKEERQSRLKAILNAERIRRLKDIENDSQKKSLDIAKVKHRNCLMNYQNSDKIKKIDFTAKNIKQDTLKFSLNTVDKDTNLIRNKTISAVKKKISKCKNEEIYTECSENNEKIKKIDFYERNLKKLSLKKVYNLEKESTTVESQFKTIIGSSKFRNKNLKLIKQNKIYREVKINDYISVRDLANQMSEKVSTVNKILRDSDIIVTVDQLIDADTAELVAHELGHKLRRVSYEKIKKTLLEQVDHSLDKLKLRAPIVTIMGHVDHGKTSLLDALRLSNSTKYEHGGITQQISGYSVSVEKDKLITFLDTPGHAAFESIRMRGAKITDIALIVISAEDGIKDQTVEAINYAKNSSVPIIVVINKIDKPGTNITKITNSLLNYGLIPSNMGGNITVIAVSAKEKIGLINLKKAIYDQSKMLNLKVNFNQQAEGVVIESKLDNLKGVIATFLVQKGILRITDTVIIDDEYFKIRSLVNDRGKEVNNCIPSIPVEVLGLNNIPKAGAKFIVVKDKKTAKKIIDINKRESIKIFKKNAHVASFENLLQMKHKDLKVFNILVRGDAQGSLEAIELSLNKLSNDKVKINVFNSIVGNITESDISLAKVTNAIVLNERFANL